jgi:hypothetical protein
MRNRAEGHCGAQPPHSYMNGLYFPRDSPRRDAVPMCTSWPDVEQYILGPRALICACSATLNCNPDADARTAHTSLRYMFFHMRCGIYVLIVGGRLAMFAPFANPEYVNNFDMESVVPALYASQKARALRAPEEQLLPQKQWWTNAGGILCNVMPPEVWGQYMLPEHLRFLESIAPHVHDCEFILNKRDHPQLRRDRREAYAHCFRGNPPLLPAEYRGSPMLRVLSGYTGPQFEDVPWPLPCDLALLSTPEAPSAPAAVWEARAPLAIFRGSSTGAFPRNVRMDLCELSLTHPGHLDAGITSKSTRDRLVNGCVVCVPVPEHLRKPRLTMAQQAQRCKYAVYVEGHSAASRYLELMLHRFVIIRVGTRHAPADRLWYFDQLQPGVDHVCVSADLSDLIPAIEWLRGNDAHAARLAHAAHALGMRIRGLQAAYAIHALNTWVQPSSTTNPSSKSSESESGTAKTPDQDEQLYS